MECDPFGWWMRLALNALAGGLAGYWWNRVRHIRRAEREVAARRAVVEENLRRSEEFFRKITAIARDDDDPAVPSLH